MTQGVAIATTRSKETSPVAMTIMVVLDQTCVSVESAGVYSFFETELTVTTEIGAQDKTLAAMDGV